MNSREVYLGRMREKKLGWHLTCGRGGGGMNSNQKVFC
jgi:hypothetical protein